MRKSDAPKKAAKRWTEADTATMQRLVRLDPEISNAEIGKALGFSDVTVLYKRRELGLSPRPRGRPWRSEPPSVRDEKIRQARREGASLEALADEYALSISRIHQIVSKENG